MRILALSGPIGAGKTSIAQMLARRFPQLQIVSTGDAVRRRLQERGLPLSHSNLQTVNDELVRQLGNDYISFVFEDFDYSLSCFVIDSVRRPVDIEFLRQRFENVLALAVDASPEMRYTRVAERRRESDPLDRESFAEMTERESVWGVDHIALTADVRIRNEGNLTDLELEVICGVGDFLGGCS